MQFCSSCIEQSPILMATMSISQRERTCRPACAGAGGRDARDASARGTRRAGGRSRRPGSARTRRAAVPRARVLYARGRPASAGATRALESTARDAAPSRGNEHELRSLHHCDEEPVTSTIQYVLYYTTLHYALKYSTELRTFTALRWRRSSEVSGRLEKHSAQ